MFGSYSERAAKSLASVAAHLNASDAFRMLVAEALLNPDTASLNLGQIGQPPEPTEWRVIDHAAALSRTYAIYEQFVHELMRELVSFIEKTGPFLTLDRRFQSAYRHGIASISQRIDYARYSHLSLPAVIADYAEALSGRDYSLLSEALLVHDKNLQMTELGRLFGPVGIENLENDLNNHPDMLAFFASAERRQLDGSSELKRFVQDRNDAAHGGLTLSEILGKDELIEYTEFCNVLCNCLAEIVQKWVIEKAHSTGQAALICSSREVFKNGFVVVDEFRGTLEKGMSIYIVNGNRCYEASVDSIQLQDIEVDAVTAIETLEAGLKISRPTKKGNRIYQRITFAPKTDFDTDDLQSALEEAERETEIRAEIQAEMHLSDDT